MSGFAKSSVAADLLRLARTRADLTQRELAQRTGVPQSVIARIESGSRQPTLPTLERVLAGAGVELHYRLETLEDHDSVLAARHAQRSPSQKRAIEDAHAAFVEKVIDGGRRARRPRSA